MSPHIKESDWKIFRDLQPLALDRFCQRVLLEAAEQISDSGKTSHERYLGLYRLLKRRDKELANAFDEPSRSSAIIQLAKIQHEGLLTKEELARFSAETRNAVQGLLDIWRS
ncbi:MAG TPA: hypothetical protein VGZ25_09265 [Gemmataceae bacterium]|jgi:hypothetical protein|nr:hypothetical protein [Gemmataceae bacterium]